MATYLTSSFDADRDFPMNTNESFLGQCPNCGKQIPEARLLVEYTKDDGETGIWADCPACNDVVAPK